MPDPLWINASAGAPSYTAAELRRAFAAFLSPKGTAGTNRFSAVDGVRPGGGTIVSLSGSTITVRAHAFVISPDLSTTQGPYVGQLPADETHSLTAAHATLSRTDLVYDQVSDHDEDASGARTATSGYLAGTAGGGVPSLPARSFEVARIAVPNSGGGSPALTERALYSVASGGVLPVRDAADRPAHYPGRMIYQIDTDAVLVSDGSAWRRADPLAGSGTANVTNGQTGTSTTLSFGYTFGVAPKVTAVMTTLGGVASGLYFLRVTATTTTGFTVHLIKADGSAFGATATVGIDWHAVEV